MVSSPELLVWLQVFEIVFCLRDKRDAYPIGWWLAVSLYRYFVKPGMGSG